MKDWNTCFAYLNMELPDDIRRLKEAGYYDAAIARIDACLAEDWTASQNQPLHPQGALPVNPTPHGVDVWRQGLLAHREILRRLPQDYTLTAEQLLNQLQATLRDFTAEEFAALDAAGQMDWRFVEGQKRYIYRAAETLVATHPDLAARQLDPPAPATLARERRRRIHDQMEREGQASARITLKTSVGMSDEAFAAALAWGLKGWDLRRVTAKCFRENHPSRHMLAACMDPTGEDETYFYFEKCIQNENDMHMDILSE